MNPPYNRKLAFSLLLFTLIPFSQSQNAYLALGDKALMWAPEADFAGEMRRLKLPPMPFNFGSSDRSYAEEAANADLSDLQAALGSISAEERELLVGAYLEERAKIAEYQSKLRLWNYESPWNDKTNRPELPVILFPSGIPLEFRLYLEGTEAFHAGSKNLARAKWQELLSLPRRERKFRSTWAAYMMAKSWLKEDDEKALEHFQLVRSLVKSGYRDSLFLAAATYGWEGRAELNRGNYLKALEHYLEAYSAGDPAALESFKVVIADVLLKHEDLLPQLAKHELLRRVLTLHLISGFSHWTAHYSTKRE